MKGTPLAWTKGLSDKEKEDLEVQLRNSVVLRRLLLILNEKLQTLSDQEVSVQDYDDPSWAFKQAHRNGERKGLKTIRDLLNFLEK